MLQGNTIHEEEIRTENLFASENAGRIAWKRRENKMRRRRETLGTGKSELGRGGRTTSGTLSP